MAALRSECWKDWHILLAIANLRTNYIYGYQGKQPPGKDFKKEFMQKFYQSELEDDPVVPSQEFTVEKLKMSLQMARITTLNNMGFQVRQQTPNFEGIDALLRRFNYWTDDIEHEPLL